MHVSVEMNIRCDSQFFGLFSKRQDLPWIVPLATLPWYVNETGGKMTELEGERPVN